MKFYETNVAMLRTELINRNGVWITDQFRWHANGIASVDCVSVEVNSNQVKNKVLKNKAITTNSGKDNHSWTTARLCDRDSI